MAGILYGVGVGPGDPELMTLKAARLIRENGVIAVPGTVPQEATAYRIAVQAVPQLPAKELVPASMPMVPDRAALTRRHEAGHAAISWLLQYGNPLVKVTIVPRGEALGAAWYLPEERQLTSSEHILDDICSLLGGRAAEELFFDTLDTGAINDLERATKKAYAMVAYFGMSDKLANMSYYDSTGQADYGFTKPYSEKTAELIDAEAKKIIAEQYERAKAILTEHKEGHNQLAQILLEREVLFAEDVEKVLGKRPWKSRADELLQSETPTDVADNDEAPAPAEPNDNLTNA